MTERMTYQTFTGLNPEFVDLDRDTDKEDAWSWTLHVRVPPGVTPQAFHEELLARTALAHSWLGEAGTNQPAACGGDSFTAWCEPFPYCPEDDQALHLYFGAPDEDCARALAVAFLALTGLDRSEVALSTGGDWAEQTDIPDHRSVTA